MNSFKKTSKIDFESFLFTVSDSTKPPYYSCHCLACNAYYQCKGEPLFNHIRTQICLDCQGIKDTENYNIKG